MIKNNFFNLDVVKLDNVLPDESTVVTFSDNVPLSYFGDDKWDFRNYLTCYVPNHIIDFAKDANFSKKIIFELKLFLYFYIYYGATNSAGLAYNTIYEQFKNLRTLAKICQTYNTTFADIQNNSFCINAIADSLTFSKRQNIDRFISIFLMINRIGRFYNLENFGFSEENINLFGKIRNEADYKLNQTLLIPTRILSEFIKNATDFFTQFNDIKSEIVNLISDKKFYDSYPSGRVRVHFNKLKKSPKLAEYFSKYSISQRPHLITHLRLIQSLGAAYISCFSGMRKGEVTNLPYDCLKKIFNQTDKSYVYLLNGYTNKLTKLGLISATWVTSSQVVPVIDALHTIVHLHQFLINIEYIKSKEETSVKNISLDKYPLFPIFNQHQRNVGIHPLYPFATIWVNLINEDITKLIGSITVEESDLEELENFNLLVDYREQYKLEVGKSWNIAFHQFRRSLAVYCCRSNIVKLPALKKQLKHISFDRLCCTNLSVKAFSAI